jgi:hypothetical protein
MLAAEALACFDAAIGQRQTRSSRPRERRVVAAHGGSRSVAPNVGLILRAPHEAAPEQSTRL